MSRAFDELVAEADSVSVEGWEFSWLDGRVTAQRPSWGDQRLLSERLAAASAALDIQTGCCTRAAWSSSRIRTSCRCRSASRRSTW